MEEGRRSGGPSRFMVKNTSSSGCLIVRKKGNDDNEQVIGSSGSRKLFRSKKEKKRARVDFSDSESSDELLMPARMRVAPETIRVCNGLSHFDKGDAKLDEDHIGRKRSRGQSTSGRNVVEDDVNVDGRNDGEEEDSSEMKRNRLDVFEFDEYEGNDVDMMMPSRKNRFDDGEIERSGRFVGSVVGGRSGNDDKYEKGPSQHPVVDRRKSSYLEKTGGDRNARPRPVSFYKDKYGSGEPIRIQGKNGVLKVMVNKKKKVDGVGADESGFCGWNALTPYSESNGAEKVGSVVGTHKSPMITLRSSSSKKFSSKNAKFRYDDSEISDASPESRPKKVDSRSSMKTPLSNETFKDDEVDSEDNDTFLKLGPKNEARKPMKGASNGGDKTPTNRLLPTGTKEGKVKRGTGTAKQKLRERIRKMLLNAGWTIDYRPRRNRDYLDAVYINPSGTAYWSIIKAYDALLKQLNDDEKETKSRVDPFTPLSDEVLSQLTRKTRKKMEEEMKMKRKQRDGSESDDARETKARKSSSSRHDEESIDSGSHEEKLSSYMKSSGKSSKSRVNGNSSLDLKSKDHCSARNMRMEQTPPGSNSRHGRNSRKLGRCTLLVRNPNEGLNSESDGLVPYAGKKTLLSWLIDCEMVQLSQKVRYMNRRRTKVMLEGWVTRDGIHCGCCSKILTISKFEIHAGSKLRQPFQNIYLDSGVSLLECQVDSWNRQELIDHIGFHFVDIDGDDPNDDTCGICGDGGDLICCDGCPSTFHQSCLDIEMLPPGDWHCPNCTCKFCGITRENFVEEDDTTVSELLTCSLCAKKYHKSCLQEVDPLPVDSNNPVPNFCGKACRELFEQLQKYLGVKHELESGFSWSLIHRVDVDLNSLPQGLPQRVECNSKLAIALSIMDECFLPVVDRRSGINVIQNVLYNCGSNFNRLNYSGFYAAILERGDEIISAASIRFHGTQLAEMPFIGTRHVYRRQGMCRRLFSAIESALSSFKVQKLIIPAISELTDTWTGVFGFTILSDSLKRELKSMNILVFPGIDVLQKQLLEKEKLDGNMSTKGPEFEHGRCTSELAAKSDIGSLAAQDLNECDNDGSEYAGRTNDKAATSNCDSQCAEVPVCGTSVIISRDSSHELNNPVRVKDTVNAGSDSGDKLDEAAAENESLCVSEIGHDVIKLDIKGESDSSAEDYTKSHTQCDACPTTSDSQVPGVSLDDASEKSGSANAVNELESVLSHERNTCANSESVDKFDDLNSASPALNLNVSACDEMKVSNSTEETKSLDCHSEGKFASPDSNGKHQNNCDVAHGAVEGETKPVDDYPIENKSKHIGSGVGHDAVDIEGGPVVDFPIEKKCNISKEEQQTLSAQTSCFEESESTYDNKSTRNIDESPSAPEADEHPIVAEAVSPSDGAADDNSTKKINEVPINPEIIPSTESATCPEDVPFKDCATGDKSTQIISESASVSAVIPFSEVAAGDKSVNDRDELPGAPVSMFGDADKSYMQTST